MKPAMNRKIAGFSLVEVTLALGVAGFCLLSIFGLLPLAFNLNRTAIEQTAANSILSGIIADMRATSPTANGTNQQYSFAIPSTASTNKPLYFNSDRQEVPNAAQGRYRVDIAFMPPLSGTKTATMVDIQVTWPAAATNAGDSVEAFAALDRN